MFDTVAVEPHHEESRRLLDAALDANSCCQCVVSPTVAGEVRQVTRRAATRAVRRAIGAHRAKKSNAGFAEMRRMVAKCIEQSFRFVSSMTMYDPRPSLVEVHLAEVDKMLETIKKRHAEMLAEQIARQAADPPVRSGSGACSGAGSVVEGPGHTDMAQYERFLERADGQHDGQDNTRRGRCHS